MHFSSQQTPTVGFQQQPKDELPTTYYLFDQSTPAQSPLPQDVAYEMEVVDELVRARSEDLPDWDDDNSSESADSSASSVISSPRSDSSYNGNDGCSSYSNDDDWSPKRSTVGSSTASGTNKPSRRNKPYARSTEDKKFRKKEQNKNAATRYRQKKKAEVEIVVEEERDLQDENDKLKTRYADVRREIKYLKGLMRDLYQAKGIL